jgi:hypothetical protein
MDDVPAQLDSGGKVLVQGTPRDRALARQALMDLARLKGYIIERKLTAAAKMSLGDLNAMLEGALVELAPGEKARMRALARGKGKLLDAAVESSAECE